LNQQRLAAGFVLDIPADHPAFNGHFPGHPVLPGVVLLAEVIAGIERCLGRPLDRIGLKVVKFHAPVGPGARLTVSLAEANGIVFTVADADTRVATGTITIDAMPGHGTP
jgi:3-hydroxymyristoyl/3-hydroxydecanoyl-(acyl carrier protein) dehydratase